MRNYSLYFEPLEQCHRFNHLSFVVMIMFFLPFRSAVCARSETSQCGFYYSDSILAKSGKPLYAVHVTRKIPQNGILRLASRTPGLVRMTIHFAIGHMVAPHLWSSWEEMPMAVLVPVRGLKSQLINVRREDSFIVGNFELPPGSILVAREDIEISSDVNLKIIRFDRSSTLRSAVQKILGEEMQEYDNSSDFWRSLGISEWQIRNDIHQETPFSVIETMLLEAMTPILLNKPQDIYLNAQIEDLIKIRKALPEIDFIVKRLNLSTISKQSLSESQIRARFYLNILEAEEKLFKEYKKTFRPLLHVYGSNIQELGSNPTELWKFIMLKMSEWPLERSYR